MGLLLILKCVYESEGQSDYQVTGEIMIHLKHFVGLAFDCTELARLFLGFPLKLAKFISNSTFQTDQKSHKSLKSFQFQFRIESQL